MSHRPVSLALALLLVVSACGGDGPPNPPRDGLAALELNDLSILLPAPERGTPWIGLDTPARGGPLVPPALLTAVIGDRPPPPDPFTVVAIRVDHCFRGRAADPCQPQLRLVLQPFGADAAFHALFAISDTELDGWLDLLLQLRADNAEPDQLPRPLGPHDIIERQGLQGSYASAIRARVLELCGAANLVRLTHSTFNPELSAGFAWDFTGVDATGAHLDIIEGQELQRLLVFIDGLTWDVSTLFTTIETPLLDQPDVAVMPASSAMKASMQALENPRHTLPDEVTCVGCHVAGPLRRAFIANWPADSWPAGDYETSHPVGEVVAPIAGGGQGLGQAFRMFGYHSGAPVVTLRVSRETADVKDALIAREASR